MHVFVNYLVERGQILSGSEDAGYAEEQPGIGSILPFITKSESFYRAPKESDHRELHVELFDQNRCRSSFLEWCRTIAPICHTIGEASMIRAFNRRQQESTSGIRFHS